MTYRFFRVIQKLVMYRQHLSRLEQKMVLTGVESVGIDGKFTRIEQEYCLETSDFDFVNI